ncbi:Protein MNN4 [Tolypocladium ophioglossoides CBS 100239]|uniref:Protein MNN4 n=1 Tax=Tolypocladium ophioglossoides (strain CBS 100239) TaxID=1163406 RepID=A0A0L0N0W8_TOLOC|nr:Protein MNN4 [Tolypocladium ophioglossoides CBS 100239]
MPSLRALVVAGLATLGLATLGLASPARSPPRSPDQEQSAGALSRRDGWGPKYFHEPGGSLARGHYDLRFFHDEIPYDEHRFVLRDLVRSYLATMHAHGVETWLAHGTLLGWWWNGQIMPWDYDLDVQVSNTTLQWMADRLNRTEHAYNSTQSHTAKTYLLDVNPHHVDLDSGDGQNIIDARWIDTTNGMFIDITGVREREPYNPGYWSCKNRHRYASQDLWPMRVSEFEGIRARVPYNFEQILTEEYGPQSLVLEEYEGHRWDHGTKEWIKMTPEDERRREEMAKERKRKEMIRDGRLPPE